MKACSALSRVCGGTIALLLAFRVLALTAELPTLTEADLGQVRAAAALTPAVLPGIADVATLRATLRFAGEIENKSPSESSRKRSSLRSALGAAAAGSTSPLPTASFAALEDNNETIPADAHGAVGPNHVMTALKTGVRIQDRDGTVLRTMSLSNFWAAVGPFNVFIACGGTYCRTQTVFNPKVVFDPYAQRWLFVAMTDNFTNSSSVLVGASQTSDPLDGWNLYRFDTDPDHLAFGDLPNVGFTRDRLTVAINTFSVAPPSSYLGANIYVFDKTDLYAGGQGRVTRFNRVSGFGISPVETYDPEVSTIYLLENWNGLGAGGGFLRLSTIYGPIGAEVFNPGIAFPSTTNAWATFGPANILPQAGSLNRIDAGDGRTGQSVYRNGTLWTVHHVFLPVSAPDHVAVQWWQLTPIGGVLQSGRIEDPNRSYAFPSLGVNGRGDVLIGHGSFNSDQFASGSYSYRAVEDPTNTFRPPLVLKSGEAAYTKIAEGDRNRWGGYTATVVDPLNDSDFWTIQQYAASPRDGFDRWGTWWGRITPPSAPPATLAVNDVRLFEGSAEPQAASFLVTLSSPSDSVVTLSYSTVNGDARAGVDYVAGTGVVTFPPNATTQRVEVVVNGDSLNEADEFFFLTLSNAVGATIGKASGLATILNDDPLPVVRVDDISVVEGDSVTNAVFVITLNGLTERFVTVLYETTNETATAGSDYIRRAGSLLLLNVIPVAGLPIQITGDSLIEDDETFRLRFTAVANALLERTEATATIIDDDFRLIEIARVENDIRVRFRTRADRSYRLEKSMTVDGVWASVAGAESIAGTGEEVAALDAEADGTRQGFYRVLEF